MSRIAESKGMYLFLQLLVLACLCGTWLVSAAEMIHGAMGYWTCGGLLLGLRVASLIRTARTLYAEECAGGLNLVFHGIAAVFFFVAAVLCAEECGILLDLARILDMIRYDLDDGLAYAFTSCGFIAAVIGVAASAMLVGMCVSVRRSASRGRETA